MKTKDEILSNLKAHSSSTPSKWREKAEWRHQNKAWLSYLHKDTPLPLSPKRFGYPLDKYSFVP